MERNRHIVYPVAVVNHQHLQHIQQHQPHQASHVTMPHQTHTTSPHRLKSHAALAQVDPQTSPPAQAEYFDISKNQPSTSGVLTQSTAFRTEVRDLAYKLNMKRGSVEKWLREKYNRTHPHDRIVHPRGFKFTDEQRQRLIDFFELNRYPKTHEMEALAYEVDCKKQQIKNWFHDQRRKFKKAEQAANQMAATKKSKFSVQKRKKLEEFFEKNFHPYPGDSRRIVNEFELGESRRSAQGGARYQPHDSSVHYEFATSNLPNDKTPMQSRGFKFSEEQRRRLREAFSKKMYPNPSEMEKIAQTIGVYSNQVKNWFHDHRRKLKKEQSVT